MLKMSLGYSGVLVYRCAYVNNPMYLTLELTDANTDRVLQYIQSLDLWSRLYIHDPDYSVCLVECDCGSAAWLGLLG